MKNKAFKLKIEDVGLWIEDRLSRFEDFLIPHQHFYIMLLYNHIRIGKNKNAFTSTDENNFLYLYFYIDPKYY